MNAPAKISPAARLLPAIDALEIRAQTRAYLWWVYAMAIDEAVDELQAYAERSGLIGMIDQDAVQAILAAPFARYRKLIEPVEPEDIPLQPCTEPQPRRHAYRAPQSTVDAFWYVVRLNDSDYLARWLADHLADAPELFQIWKGKRC
jgi:hypothetical protein